MVEDQQQCSYFSAVKSGYISETTATIWKTISVPIRVQINWIFKGNESNQSEKLKFLLFSSKNGYVTRELLHRFQKCV